MLKRRKNHKRTIAFACAMAITAIIPNSYVCKAVSTDNDSSAVITSEMRRQAPNRGDVNGDGKINSIDASCVLNMYAMNSTTIGSNLYSWQADMDGDGKVNAGDASAILALYAELSTCKIPESYLRQEVLYSMECPVYTDTKSDTISYKLGKYHVFFVLRELREPGENWVEVASSDGRKGFVKRLDAYDADVIGKTMASIPSTNPVTTTKVAVTTTTKAETTTKATETVPTVTTAKTTATVTTAKTTAIVPTVTTMSTTVTVMPVTTGTTITTGVKYYAYLDSGEPWKIRSSTQLISKELPNNNIIGCINHNEVFEVTGNVATDWYSVRKYNDDGTISIGNVYMPKTSANSSFKQITKEQYEDVVFRGKIIDFSNSPAITTTAQTTVTTTTTVLPTTMASTTTTVNNAVESKSIFLMYRSDGIPWKIRSACDTNSNIVGTVAFDEVVELKKHVGNNWYLCAEISPNFW